MAHKNEFISTENGYKVLNDGTETTVINQDGTLNGSAVIDDNSVTLAKLATAVKSSDVIKFVKLGSDITTTALVGLEVGDLVLQFVAADGTVVAAPCATADTLPNDPADADYIVVLRATA